MTGASPAGALDPLGTGSISPALPVNLHTDIPILQLQAGDIKTPEAILGGTGDGSLMSTPVS